MTQRIDAHHHFWHYATDEYGWISNAMQPLQRDFLSQDLREEMNRADVQGAVSVQARQTLDETRWLLRLAEKNSFARGVVGWAPLTSADFPEILDEFAANPKLKGLRHVLQDEPDDGFMLREEFNRGIRALGGTELVYDILIHERHLPTAAEFVDRHLNQIFVLDHLAKPAIREQRLSPWNKHLKELAKRPHVYCKISGMVTEANWDDWTTESLQPYFDTALECFGPSRLLAGSDWPVCLLASSYGRWWQTLDMLVSTLSVAEQAAILGDNAVRVYHLDDGGL